MLKIRWRGNYEKYFSNLRPHVRQELNNQSEWVAHEVRKKSLPYVPKKTGKLRGSYRATNTYGTNKVVVEVEYRARRKGGFVYSYIQEHKQYRRYTTPGTGSRYLRKGMVMSITPVRNRYIQTMRRAVHGRL